MSKSNLRFVKTWVPSVYEVHEGEVAFGWVGKSNGKWVTRLDTETSYREDNPHKTRMDAAVALVDEWDTKRAALQELARTEVATKAPWYRRAQAFLYGLIT